MPRDTLETVDTQKLIKSYDLMNRCKCEKCQEWCAKFQAELDKRELTLKRSQRVEATRT